MTIRHVLATTTITSLTLSEIIYVPHTRSHTTLWIPLLAHYHSDGSLFSCCLPIYVPVPICVLISFCAILVLISLHSSTQLYTIVLLIPKTNKLFFIVCFRNIVQLWVKEFHPFHTWKYFLNTIHFYNTFYYTFLFIIYNFLFLRFSVVNFTRFVVWLE